MHEKFDPHPEVGLNDIVIVGNGISAFALARKLSQEAGIASTVIAPHTPTFAEADLPTDMRTSIPTIRRSTLEQLGIPTDGYTSISKRTLTVEKPLNLVRRWGLSYLQARRTANAAKYTKYILDVDLTRRQLYEASIDDPNITIVPGRFTDVDVTDGKITNITIDGTENIRPQVVIDATGGQARVAKRVQTKGNAVVEKQISQPSTLVGGFIALDSAALSHHPFLIDEARISLLKGGLALFIAPADHIPESPATHIFFIEGSSETVAGALQAVKENTEHHLPRQEHYIQVLKLLTQGTVYEQVVDCIRHIDRTIYHRFKKATRRHIQAEGMNLGLVGDAHVQVNPISATGFKNIAQDITVLVDCFSGTSSLADGISKYNQSSERRAKRKMREARVAYFLFGSMYRFFGIAYNVGATRSRKAGI